MYTQFYGLREKPFGPGPNPRYLFLADSHREALAHLLYGIEQGEGFIAITGEVGTGKTTACRTLLQRIGPGTEVAFVFNPQLSPLELFQQIGSELGLEIEGKTRREIHEALNHFLLAKKNEGRRVLLLVDEAQNLAPDTLEQIRLLSNLETETSKLIQILLIGQPELDVMLESPSLRKLRQSITVRWRLKPLTASETRDYVRHRLRIAAGEPRDIFSDLSLREIHRRARGIPRIVNLLCDRALLAGYAAGATTIGLGLVTQSDRELRASKRPRPEAKSLPRAAWTLPVLAAVALGVAAGDSWQRFFPSSGGAEEPPVVAAAPSEIPASVVGGTVAVVSRSEVKTSAQSAQAEAALPAVGAARPLSPPPAFAEDFSEALALRAPGVTTSAALRGLLGNWGEARENIAPVFSLTDARSSARALGLRDIALNQASRRTLEVLDLPVLLELRADDGATRTVALVGLEANRAQIYGVDGGASREVAWDQLASCWTGSAVVLWRDFESLPNVMSRGLRGSSVSWLQSALAAAGLYNSPVTGYFNLATAAGVRAFQQLHQLRIDGSVGPVTKMALYKTLEGYDVPRLSDTGAAE